MSLTIYVITEVKDVSLPFSYRNVNQENKRPTHVQTITPIYHSGAFFTENFQEVCISPEKRT